MIDNGIFTLKTPVQLFAKLCKDYERVKANPTDANSWFNFVVTANHLPEWESEADTVSAGKLREREPILRICDHLARNAKHFTARDRKRKGTISINAVAGTNEAQTVRWDEQPGATSDPVLSEFILTLSPREARELGKTDIPALELAKRVVDFWRSRLNLPNE